ncbi:MAG TPA: hypothetical protein DHW78_05460 [Ruminococcaceae bacterium]|jgi:predicted ATPase|nr:hypothetical protein [Oscillospiraceae bacterium]
MKLKSITVGGFRNLKRTTVNFDGITALVALNSFGKSNYLRAIEFGINFYKGSSAMRKRSFSDESAMPLNKITCNDDFYFELEIENSSNADHQNIIYGYTFRWKRVDKTGAKITSEWLKVKPVEKKKFTQIINRSETKALYRNSESGRCSKKSQVAEDEMLLQRMASLDDCFYTDIIKAVLSVSIFVDHRLDRSDEYEIQPLIPENDDGLSLNSSIGVPHTMAILKEKCPDEYAKITDAFCQLYPNISKIEVKSYPFDPISSELPSLPKDIPYTFAKAAYILWVIDDTLNQPIPFEALSDGAKRILWMFTCIAKAKLNQLALIAIEEPENSVHPKLLQSYLDIINQLLDGCSMIMTSHSPYIVGYLPLKSLMIGLPNDDGTACFYPIKGSQNNRVINDARESDMTTGTYIFDLLSGSESDYEQLRQYLDCGGRSSENRGGESL